MISARVFITNGPAQAIGSRIGAPLRTTMSWSEHCELPGAYPPALGADCPGTGEHVDQRIEVRTPGQPQGRTGLTVACSIAIGV